MAQRGSILMSGEAEPVPISAPGSPAAAEGDMAAIIAKMSALEEALTRVQAENRIGHATLEKVKAENKKLREALITGEEGDNAGAPAMPETYMLMTPQRPADSSPWTEDDWSANWDHQPTDPPGFAEEAPAAPPDTDRWGKSAWEREPWCAPAWGTRWHSPPQCDPWAEYRTNAARAETAWPPQPWSSQPWSQQACGQGSDWGDQ